MVTVVRVVPGARERLVQITGPGYDNIVQVRSIYHIIIIRYDMKYPLNQGIPIIMKMRLNLNNISIDICTQLL